MNLHDDPSGTVVHGGPFFVASLPGDIVFLLCLARCYKILISISFLLLAKAVYSRVVPYPTVALVDLDSSLREERSWHLSVDLCTWIPTRTRPESRCC